MRTLRLSSLFFFNLYILLTSLDNPLLQRIYSHIPYILCFIVTTSDSLGLVDKLRFDTGVCVYVNFPIRLF